MSITEIDQKLKRLRGEHKSVNLIMKLSHDPLRKQRAAHNAVAIEGEIAELEQARAAICEGVQ